MSKINPLADRVVLETEKAEAKTASGIYLTSSAQEKPKEAKVIEVGPDVKTVKKNDVVIYEEFTGTTLKIGADEYVIVKEENILATVGK